MSWMIRRMALVAVAALVAAVGSSASASTPPGAPAPDDAAPACSAAVPAASSEPAMSTDGADGALLVGTWCVVSIGSDDVAAVGASVEFTADGTVQGFGGVNRFSGPYTATADTIEFGPVAATLMAGPEPAMSVETALLAAFVDAQPYAVDGDRLTLGEEPAIVLHRGGGTGGAAGGDGADDIVTVSGTITYRERMALPEGAVVVVEVHDVSPADAQAPPVARATIIPTHGVPIPYAIAVSSASYVDDHPYALSVTILVGDDVLFTSVEPVVVPAAPADQRADLVLVRAA